MSISNYTELQTAVKNWLHRSDLDTRIQEFISLGEAHLNREISSAWMEEAATISTSVVDRYAALPVGCLDVIAIINSDGDELKALSSREVAALAQQNTNGEPSAYSAGSQIAFDCVSDQVYSLLCLFRGKLDIATDSTNWLLTKYPDAYLYSALFDALPFIKDDARVVSIKSIRDEVIALINTADRRKNAVLRCDSFFANDSFDINRGY